MSPLVLGLTVLMAGILSVVSVVRATESPEVDPTQGAIDGPFGSDARVSLSLPLQANTNLSLGAETESPTGEPSASELNRQLTNPVSSIWFIANQFNNFELNNGHWNNNWNFQPVLPVGLTKDWNLITRPVMPFYNIVPHETAPVNSSGPPGWATWPCWSSSRPRTRATGSSARETYRHLPDCDLAFHWPRQMAARP